MTRNGQYAYRSAAGRICAAGYRWNQRSKLCHVHEWRIHTMETKNLFLVALAISGAMVVIGAPARAQEVLPFPPTPSASIAGRTMQESVYTPRRAAPPAGGRAEHPHRAHRRRRPGPAEHLRRGDQHADDGSHRQGRHRLQPVSHDGHVFADAGGAALRAGTITASATARSPSWRTTGTATPASSPKAAPRWPRC